MSNLISLMGIISLGRLIAFSAIACIELPWFKPVGRLPIHNERRHLSKGGRHSSLKSEHDLFFVSDPFDLVQYACDIELEPPFLDP